ncbi:U-box domain-containing protein 33-like isoform X2 [Silene latifolia]|uniref:U-box domain-containing protein 33-like isoform X2 n=1 Tax=Silene latifolia TaxID=37657 RepID=UPI003D77A578
MMYNNLGYAVITFLLVFITDLPFTTSRDSLLQVKVSIIVSEAEQVHKGLAEVVFNHDIQKLIMGSVSGNCVKVNSSKANHAAKNIPAFCEIWFIYKGKHIWTREAFERHSLNFQCEKLSLGRLRSKSYRHKKSEHLYNSDHLRFISSRLSMNHSVTGELVQNGHTEEDLLRSAGEEVSPSFARTSTSNGSASIARAERISFPGLDIRLEEESLYAQLLEVKTEAETLKDEALAEHLKRETLEAEALQAMKKVKEIELIHSGEAKLRMEAEDAFRSMLHDQEGLLEERRGVTRELQKTMRNVAVLDCRVQEANQWCDDIAEELKPIQVCIASLRLERQRIWRQKMEADRWLERWRSRRQTGGTNREGCGGVLGDVPELVEFSLLDLQSATCNFSESFKISERGFCSVYKGELLGRTISIQRLHAQTFQAPSQFEKEVEVLGKLRHPHLINLLGACPEAWSLVYDYVPATLQHRLFQERNNFSWKIRARIISEIATGLLFLHSSHPEKIVHGNLQLENILLDSELHCKLCDFGISRLLSQDTLRCPSFGRYPESKGAFPYKDPEILRAGELSPKSDVYSFGVVILQLLTGLPPVGLVANARKAVSSARLTSVLDPSAGNWGPFVAEKIADMALRFCEPNSRDRPELTPALVRELQQLHMSQERPAPPFFVCPILQEIMCDPQVAADGFTYEGEAIREWLEYGRETSPLTNLKLDHLHLTANHSLRLAIQEWLCKC